jgi:hypothetical protein
MRADTHPRYRVSWAARRDTVLVRPKFAMSRLRADSYALALFWSKVMLESMNDKL